MRTQEEIAQRFKDAQARDPLGFEYLEYLQCMTFDTARPFLKPETTAAEWNDPVPVERIDCAAKDYMKFWLEKIEDERGISVCRATSHFVAWKWLLGHPDSDTFPGSINGPDGGWYQRTAYEHIKAQMESGEWDRMTKEAQS